MASHRAVLTLVLAAVLGASAIAVPAAKPAAAAPVHDWLSVVVATPQGGFRQGNPNAKVRLLEFGSLTCPHCAAFAREHVPTLRTKYIAVGKVSYEYRPYLLHGADYAPSLLVECQAPVAAVRLIEGFYAQQATWLEPFTKPFPDDFQKQIAKLPELNQITAFAARGGLDGFMRARGMTRSRFDACTSDKAGLAKLTAIREDANTNFGLSAVPTFVINGKTVVDVYDWDDLQPALDTALAS